MENMKPCAFCSTDINTNAIKCPHCMSRQPGTSLQLHRGHSDRMIAGVCSGLARQLGTDTTVMRVIVAFAALMSFGLVFWGYALLWVLLPRTADSKAPAARFFDWVRSILAPEPMPQPLQRRSELAESVEG